MDVSVNLLALHKQSFMEGYLCYELIFNDYQLIFDTGTGFRNVKLDNLKTIIFIAIGIMITFKD